MTRLQPGSAESLLRTYALSYPETTEHFPWGERVVKVRGKVFVFLSQTPERLGVTVKLPLSGLAALTLPFAASTGYGLGRSGWVTATFPNGTDVPVVLMKEWIDESYRAIAPKAIVDALPPFGSEPARKVDRRPPTAKAKVSSRKPARKAAAPSVAATSRPRRPRR